MLFGANGSGKSGYFRILNKLASGSINYSVMQDIFNENPQPMSIEVTYAENGTDHPMRQMSIICAQRTIAISWYVHLKFNLERN